MNSILIVDDDKDFCVALCDSFIKRGYECQLAHYVTQALQVAEHFNPEWVLVDLNMPGPSGLELIAQLLAIDPATRIVVLTGYANINTAVEAIKLGAIHYLSKPVSTEEIIAAFHKQEGDPTVAILPENLKLDAAEREHILTAYERNSRNISATARELGMHRRTLQRKLDKIR
ncbi:MAG: response regulator [Rickettsiales bacterium]|nr:response regulator [Rickettsiales bacterium]